jgi:hypothetical protein
MARSSRKFMAFLVVLVSLGCLGMAEDKALDIDPVYQQQTEWCWVTTGQMVLEYLNEPAVNRASYQCGIVALFFGPGTPCFYNCFTCNVPASSTAVLRRMLSGYPAAAAAILRRPIARFRPEPGVLCRPAF